VLNFSGLEDAPTAAPPNVGCYRTLLGNSRFCPDKNAGENGDLQRGRHVPAAFGDNPATYSHSPSPLQTVRYNTVQTFSGSFSVTATARLDLRLSTKDRERIDRAAALAGLPLAAFVRSAVLREADRMVAAESVATLSLAESKRFLAALGKPFAPNAELRRAMKRGNELGI
jgi:uncharacterized protein (DUF1778 family)